MKYYTIGGFAGARRASLLLAVCRDPDRNRRAFIVRASSHSARFTVFYCRAVMQKRAAPLNENNL